MKKTMSQFIKYCFVGVFNTGIGLFCIYTLLWGGANPYLANLLGYCVGFIFSYLINSKYVFRKPYSKAKGFKFFIGVGVAYLFNLFGVFCLLYFYPNAVYLAQLAGIIIYTVISFLITKLWVMK